MSWRDNTVVVEGRRFTFHDMTDAYAQPTNLFHASLHEMAEGTVIRPQISKKNFAQSPDAEVCLSSDPRRAIFWARSADAQATRVWLYLVEPEGTISIHRAGLSNYGNGFTAWEARVAKASIVAAHEIDVTGNIILPEEISTRNA